MNTFKKNRNALCCFFFCVFIVGSADASHRLWYKQPATDWQTQALPIGNGRFGGMIFGGVAQEHIQFNDKSLWTGNKTTRGAYQNFGDVYVDFTGVSTFTDYTRELSLDEAIARVNFTAGGVAYSREYFCSYPDNVMVMRFAGNQPGKVGFSLKINNAHTGTTTVSGNRINMSGALTLLSYETQMLVLNKGGTLTSGTDKITVTNADSATVLLACGTNYDPLASTYTSTGLHERVTTQVDNAALKPHNQLKANHLNDYQPLFNRVVLNLDETTPTIPTDQLLKNYKSGTYDPALEVLFFQYGRYFMISCSRPGLSLPSNLQGLWNNSNTPGWECDIHSNINVQMNYWPAEITNLSECHGPFLDYIYNEAVKQTAWKNYASSLGCKGWTMKTQNNIFGYSDWEWNRPANAWYCMHVWQHYTYTLDSAYLLNKAYPPMKSACEFWIDRLITDTDGKLVAPDEWSPEHGPWEKGVSYAQHVIWDLFTNTIRACEILKKDSTFKTTVQSKLANLDPGLRIDNNGQFREWKYSANNAGEDKHRHLSHLLCLYPGKQVSPWIDSKYSDAVKASLNARGDDSYGWAVAQRIVCWARLLDGNRALTIFRKYLLGGGKISDNLFDIYPPFQIDANFGAVADVVELLLQSYLDIIDLLPALPDAWAKGSVAGLCAQNGFDVSMEWDQKAFKQAIIKSKKGAVCPVRNKAFSGAVFVYKVSDNAPVPFTKNGATITFNTISGESYKILLSASITNHAPIAASSIKEVQIMGKRDLRIRYELSHDSPVIMRIYLVNGKKVAEVIREAENAGEHEVIINRDLLSGRGNVFLLCMKTEFQTSVKKIALNCLKN